MIKRNDNSTDATIAAYVVKGILADNENTAIDRLSALFAHNNRALEFLVNGVPVSVKVVNPDIIINYNKDIKSVKNAEITQDFHIKADVVKIQKRYFEDEESAAKADRWDGNNRKTDDCSFERIFEIDDFIYITDELKDAVEVEYL